MDCTDFKMLMSNRNREWLLGDYRIKTKPWMKKQPFGPVGYMGGLNMPCSNNNCFLMLFCPWCRFIHVTCQFIQLSLYFKALKKSVHFVSKNTYSLVRCKQMQILAPKPVLRTQLEEAQVKIIITLERCKGVQNFAGNHNL